MKLTVDVTGCVCPEPVIRTKKAMKEEHSEIVVLVDNQTACENVKRLAAQNDHSITVEEDGNIYRLMLKKN